MEVEMLRKTIFILALFAAAAALAAPDSLACRMIDWLDAPTNYNFRHDGGEGYTYTGTYRWDLAMGDSILWWLPGSRIKYMVDVYNTSSIDTVIEPHSGSEDVMAMEVKEDSLLYYGGGAFFYSTIWKNDSMSYNSYIYTGFADYCYAVVEDSFLYTCNFGDMDSVNLTCINIADPESIFIYRGIHGGAHNAGLEVIDGHVHVAGAYGNCTSPPYPYECRAYWFLGVTDMLNPDSAVYDSGVVYEERCLGDLASNDSLVFYVNCEMTPGSWAIGHSNLYVWDRDYTFAFDSSLWFGQGVFGVDVIDDRWLAVGFEHGFSVLDIEDLTDIHEVAYYQHIDSVMDFTHFALKENRLYAMGHLDEGGVSTGTVRLWMLELDTASMMQVYEYSPPTPDDFRIRAYPNPFNSAVRISVDAPVGAGLRPARVEIFDIAGRRAAQLPSPSVPLPEGEGGNSFSLWEKVSEGRMRAEFTWRPDATVGSGIYLVRARLDGQTVTKRVVYLK